MKAKLTDEVLSLLASASSSSPGQSVLGNFFQLSAATTHHVPSEDLNRINDTVPKICVLSAKVCPQTCSRSTMHGADSNALVDLAERFADPSRRFG
jgi:hypothetical protein